MIYIFRNLVMILVFALCFSYAAMGQQQGFTESQLQRNFAESVTSLPNVLQAQWQSPVDLWVYMEGSDKEAAQSVAERVVLLAQTEFGQSLCVNVHDGNYNPMVTKCWSAL